MKASMPKTTAQTTSFNPFLIGIICGIYPLLFYYSNNFSAINTWEHFGFFTLFFIGLPTGVFLLLKILLNFFPKTESFRNPILFVCIVMSVAVLMSFAMYLMLKKKVLVLVFVISIILAWKLGNQYKKLLILVLIMSLIPLGKNIVHIYEHQKPMPWASLPDAIADVRFVHKPNIYLIQPDGYVGRTAMREAPYELENPLYPWLEEKGFTLYDDFRSNYPASLTSNSSMFSMKQHRFNNMLFPSIEMPNARNFISGTSSALEILKSNGYRTFFIVEDEYFQQNRPEPGYDFYNINFKEIPYFSDDNSVKKDVFADLKNAMKINVGEAPKFFFVEKLLPHHIHFIGTKEEERQRYLERIREVNEWIKETTLYIQENDPTALVIFLADHGGWVDLGSYPEMFSITNKRQLTSIFSTLAAIKWNGYLHDQKDQELRSNVNLFRVLFSVLSDEDKYLKYLEDNSSYNLKTGTFSNSVRAVLDDHGNVIAK